MKPSSELAAWMRSERRRRGISQTTLGVTLGKSQSTIARIENGKHTISWDEGWEIIAALEDEWQPSPVPPGWSKS